MYQDKLDERGLVHSRVNPRGGSMGKDMRSWIQELENAGEIVHIEKPVHPHTQMGALLYQSRDKALLFENVDGFPGWKSLGMAPANVRHAALAYETSIEELVPLAAERSQNWIPTEMVENGPVKEKVLVGDEVDLTKLPVHVNGSEETPYIASGLMITRDPDTGKRNVAFHRLQVKGPRKVGALFLPRHTRRIYDKYEARNEAMPVAIFIGHHPLYYMAAATTGPYDMSENRKDLSQSSKTTRCRVLATTRLSRSTASTCAETLSLRPSRTVRRLKAAYSTRCRSQQHCIITSKISAVTSTSTTCLPCPAFSGSLFR